MTRATLACILAFTATPILAAVDKEEKAAYVRIARDKSNPECTFTIKTGDEGWSIESVTRQGLAMLTITSRYDAKQTLLGVKANLDRGDERKPMTVEVKDGKATILRGNAERQEFEVPRGAIVTSAPDWTDVFLMCRHYDRKKAGTQEFPGLWIHHTQKCQRLTFTAERTGADTIEHDGKKQELDCFVLRIRNNSEYAAWADDKGQMIKLTPLPVKVKDGYSLIREGYEKSAAKLLPPAK